jgi:hypothetical protein
VTPWDDEDDWVGEPPEGRYTRDRAKPEFWRGYRPVSFVGAGLFVALLILLIVLIL